MSSLERPVVSLHGGLGLLADGAQVSGRYIVQASLGRGGMAAVYQAFDPKLNLEVALKVLPPHLAVQPTFLSRFRREGQTLAKLNHPHILRLYEIGEDPANGLYYLVLELLGGGTLKQRLTRKPWSVGETVDLLRPVVAALDYAHGQKPPVVHRDLKPANIMFDTRGRVVVSDFGLARLLTPDHPSGADLPSMSLTVDQVVGTPAYMAPEQAEGRPVGPAADLYAVGIIAYELLTGSVPFQADTPLATLLQVVNRPLPLPTALNRSLSAATERVLLKALGRDPAHRFSTGAELVDALAASDNAPLTIAAARRPRVPGRRLHWPAGLTPRQARLAAIPLTCAVLVLGGRTYGLIARETSAPLQMAPTPQPVVTPLLVPTPTNPSRPTPAPTPLPTRTLPPSPSPTRTPNTAEAWSQTSQELDLVWGKDWPRTIADLEAFRGRFPDHDPSAEKLYAALVASGQALLDGGQTAEGVAQLEQAVALAPGRGEAPAALAALTPTPVPTPTRPAPQPQAPTPRPPARPTPVPAPARPASVPAAPPPPPVAPPPAPTPTKTGLRF